MPLHSVEPLRLYRQIASQIAALIDSGEFPVGSRLPAERELATLLHVSRTSVREAVVSLEIAGRVEVRVGSGIFVARPKVAPIVGLIDEGPSPFDLLAARRMIEGETAALAARTARRADLAALRAAIARMRELVHDFARTEATDREFHVRIATATGNSSLALVVENLWQQRRGKLWSRIEAFFHTKKIREAMLLDHLAIVDAIERRDATAARRAMHKHLARVEKEFQGQWDAIAPLEPPRAGVHRATGRRRGASALAAD